jgi:hypothetical protein
MIVSGYPSGNPSGYVRVVFHGIFKAHVKNLITILFYVMHSFSPGGIL